MKYALVIALCCVGLARPLAAAESYQALLVTAADEDEARGRVTELIDIKLYTRVVGFPNELPKALEPDSLAGAPKGKWLVVLSICSKKADAKKLLTAVKGRIKDAALATVKGTHADMCLPKQALAEISEEESRLIQGVLRDQKHAKPRSAYANFLQGKGRLEEAETQLKKALEVEPDDMEAKNLLGVIQVLRQP